MTWHTSLFASGIQVTNTFHIIAGAGVMIHIALTDRRNCPLNIMNANYHTPGGVPALDEAGTKNKQI